MATTIGPKQQRLNELRQDKLARAKQKAKEEALALREAMVTELREALRRWRGLHDGIVEMTPLEWKRKKKAERARRARAERTRKSKRRRK